MNKETILNDIGMLAGKLSRDGMKNLACDALEIRQKLIDIDKGQAVLSNSTDGLSAEAFAEIKQALTDLVDLKEYKDKHGKDKAYEVMRPMVWQSAFDALGR